jgi:hypothetical protein
LYVSSRVELVGWLASWICAQFAAHLGPWSPPSARGDEMTLGGRAEGIAVSHDLQVLRAARSWAFIASQTLARSPYRSLAGAGAARGCALLHVGAYEH